MNRRTLTKSAILLPGLSTLEPRGIRANRVMNNTTPVHMIVTSHCTTVSAERYRRSWIGKVFETWGEWYPGYSEPRNLPGSLAAMPGTLSYHEVRYGESGEEQEYLVGAFRREYISCIVRIREDNESLMNQIAQHIASQPVPGLLASAWSTAQLRTFIPNGDDLGLSISEGSLHFP